MIGLRAGSAEISAAKYFKFLSYVFSTMLPEVILSQIAQKILQVFVCIFRGEIFNVEFRIVHQRVSEVSTAVLFHTYSGKKA